MSSKFAANVSNNNSLEQRCVSFVFAACSSPPKWKKDQFSFNVSEDKTKIETTKQKHFKYMHQH